MKVTTENGFTCELNEKKLDSPSLFKKLVAMQRGDTTYLVDVIDELLGEGGWDALAEFTKDEEGNESMRRMSEEFYAVLKTAAENSKADSKKN